jgi:O-antigen/teichoic acid export membrane protein
MSDSPGSRGRASFLRSRTLVQTAIFFSSSLSVSILGAVSTVVLARALGPADFGRYAFAVSFVLFAAMFFEFGLFLPAARLTASADESEKRRVLGAALLAYIPIGLAFSLTIFGLSYGVDLVFHTHAGHALRIVAPLAFGYPFAQIARQLAQGADRLHVASINGVIIQILFVASLLLAIATGTRLSATLALALRAVALLLGSCVFVVWIQPVLRGASGYVRAFLRHARSYGFTAYVGRVFSIGTYNMDALMLGALSNPRAVGLYALAGSIAYVSGLPVLGMATALFPRMTKESSLRRVWILLSWGVGCAAVVLAWGLAPPFLRLVFSPRYAAAGALVLPLALAQLVRGVTSVYNGFLAAHARGRELRNTSVVLTVTNVALNFALIPPFGAAGAAWASFLALTVNLVSYVLYYRRWLELPRRAALA